MIMFFVAPFCKKKNKKMKDMLEWSNFKSCVVVSQLFIILTKSKLLAYPQVFSNSQKIM